MAQMLAEVLRGGKVESQHLGWVSVCQADGRVIQETPGAPSVFPRSAAKPFQALPLVVSGAFDALEIPEECLAIACASHAGEAYHLQAVLRILAAAKLDPEDLQCGAHPPFCNPMAPATALANNCSGKHAGMLATCRFHGWPIDSYRDPAHPLQVAIRDRIEQLSQSQPDFGIDGCGVPAWYLQLRSLALAFAALTGEPAGRRILAAMSSHPEMVAGTGRRDTLIMTATKGRVVSKGGAEGVSAGCVPHLGIGFALKVQDGNSRAVGPALITLLRSLELLDDCEAQVLKSVLEPEITNHAGTVVGSIRPVGQTALVFRRAGC